jgi:hypothetical protein
MSAYFTYYDTDENEINSGNPISFGEVQIGAISDVHSIWIWNDKGGVLSADTSETPHLFAIKSGDDDLDILFSGNELNGYNSMLEARSCGAKNTVSDNHENWTPIGPMQYLQLGPMPSNSARLIELRINAPYNADLFDLSDFTLRISG